MIRKDLGRDWVFLLFWGKCDIICALSECALT